MTKPNVPTALRCKALLFDLDGTLIDSLPAVDRAWTRFAVRHGLDPDFVLAQIHGKRSLDSIRLLLPHVDAFAEDAVIRSFEAQDTEGVRVLQGTRELLESLPKHCWAVVTSGTSDVATARLKATRLPEAGAYVFGEDVARGKPHPDPFALGAERLGFHPSECVGFEDTSAGIQSILASGAVAVAVASPIHKPWVKDLNTVKALLNGDSLELSIESN